MSKPLWVVVGLIERDGKILIAKRPTHVDQGGLWEFPGGKREADESSQTALARELQEELGISVTQSAPCFQFEYSYPHKTILFDCWRVNDYTGVIKGAEGQSVKWVEKTALNEYEFPAANLYMVERM